MKMIFKICHTFDGAEIPAYVSSESSPVREAVYTQFVAERHYGESAGVLNAGIALALVELYGCDAAEPSEDATELDMHVERGHMCGAGYHELMADSSLRRDGLAELVCEHIEI